MHSISILGSGAPQATTIEETSLSDSIPSVSPQRIEEWLSCTPSSAFRNITKVKHYTWYYGFFGRIDVQSKSTSLSRSNPRKLGNRVISEEEIVRFTPSFSRRALELRLVISFGKISRTLSTYTTLKQSAPIFEICKYGDLQDLQTLLSSGTVSPFVVDEFGWSLLHVNFLLNQLELNGSH